MQGNRLQLGRPGVPRQTSGGRDWTELAYMGHTLIMRCLPIVADQAWQHTGQQAIVVVVRDALNPSHHTSRLKHDKSLSHDTVPGM